MIRPAAPVATLGAALLFTACTPRPPAPPPAAGQTLAAGPATALSASPDGSRLAWLSGCVRSAAPGAITCTLLTAPATGAAGPPARVADGVAPGPASQAWGPDGAIAALARRDPVSGAGELVVQRPGAEPRLASPRATAFALGPAGALAVVADGALRVEWPGREAFALQGGGAATEVAFAPAPARAVAARVRGDGGVPLLLLWRDGAAEPVIVARDVGAWAFSPDGGWLAAQAGMVPGADGDLVVVPVAAGGAPEPRATGPSTPRVLARGAGEFRWGPPGTGLGWLQSFDARIRSGALSTGSPGEAPVARGDRVTAWELSRTGEVALVRHATAGAYSAILEFAPPAGGAPAELARDPAGMAFGADGGWLWFRASCAPAGDACALFRVKAGGGTPERLADAVLAFALDPSRPDVALVTSARKDGAGGDLALWSAGRLLPLDGPVVVGSALVAGRPGGRAAWISAAPGRAGVRLADLP